MSLKHDIIVDATRCHFVDLGWSKEDIDRAMAWVTVSLIVLRANGIPDSDKRYPEVLRALATALELNNESN